MLYLSSILVPLDGSGFAEQALPHAIQLVRAWRSKLRLASVHVPASSWDPGREFSMVDPQLDQQLRDRELAYLSGIAKRIIDEHDFDVECAVLDGAVADALETYVAQTRTDLIVLTSHGRGGLGRVVLGNVADQLIRRLEVPILAIRPVDGAIRPPLRRILVPLDGSALADSIMEQAKMFARVTRAELMLAMIMQPVPVLLPPFVWPPVQLLEPPEQREHAGRLYLDLWKQQLTEEGFAVQTRVRTARKVAKEILQLVKDEECGMLAIATHGAGGLDRIMLGSVTDQVLRHSEVPVLVLRPGLADRPEATPGRGMRTKRPITN